ncbi:TetR/AcrR family transcriptional regulator [Actinoplanes sp. NBRC 101535]|uniref:TetR/AcrR family transcriptional regulator n=1 Tax=Actinoplanes sp. NBRC 101535 TaxID=3032196 RepID=UPI00249FC1E9|nr:TetR/AcrR family transcriptional regulator [Actinoplanes sp. NBRC 101535]GLY00118.1 TetR family transcriptional regulator [Actinoplanes sp. NBRC 101535]
MVEPSTTPSPRRSELLELAYDYVGRHGLAALSLRPLAAEIGSSPRVLLFLFGSKEGLIRELLARARADELAMLRRLGTHASSDAGGREPLPGERLPQPDLLAVTAEQIWLWLSHPAHRSVLVLWTEAYGQSLADPAGPWSGFAASTVTDWLTMLADSQPDAERHTSEGLARRTAVLAVLRGAMLDLLATGDHTRVTDAVLQCLHAVTPARHRG